MPENKAKNKNLFPESLFVNTLHFQFAIISSTGTMITAHLVAGVFDCSTNGTKMHNSKWHIEDLRLSVERKAVFGSITNQLRVKQRALYDL